MFNLINLYLVKKFFKVWILTILAISCLIIIIDFSEFYHTSSATQASLKLRLLYSLYRVPNDIINFFVLHVVIASFFSFWVLGKSGELLAITCSGKHPLSVIYQLLVFIVPIVLIFSLFLSSLAAYSMQEREMIKGRIYNSKVGGNIIDRSNHWFNFNYEGDIYYAQFKLHDKEKTTFKDIFLLQISEDYQNMTIHEIDEIQVLDSKWYLKDDRITRFSGEGDFVEKDIWEAPIQYEIISKGTASLDYLSFLNIPSTVSNLKSIAIETSKYLYKFAYLLTLPFIFTAALLWSFAAAFNKARSKGAFAWKWIVAIAVVLQLSLFGFRIVTSILTESYIHAMLLSLVFPFITIITGFYALYYQTNK